MAPAPKAGSAFAARLLSWFRQARRDLPWRRTRDPWAIWVSEVMLQQTRVEAVRVPFARFLAAYPTPAAFAAASEDELLVAWRGLGYYRRARLLQQGAREVVARHGGVVPDDVEALAELPGIGAYTRGAVASIAFGRPVVAIDGNVLRVTARHRGVRSSIETAAAQTAVRQAVEAWLDPASPGDFNQAMMELGAVVCTKAQPRCGDCPVAAGCVARTTDSVADLPVKKAPRAALDVAARVVLRVEAGHALGVRIPVGEPNAGQVELPGPGVLVAVDALDFAAELERRFGCRLTLGPVTATVKHAITHHRITVRAHTGELRRRGRLQWFPLATTTPWTTPARKVFAATGLDLGEPAQQA